MSQDRVLEIIDASVAAIAGLREQAAGIADLCKAIANALRSGASVLTAGNGGSAAEAMHMSEELVGRFRGDRVSLPSICLAGDSTVLTCIANDYGYENVFGRQIEGLGKPGDVLVLFSTSGRSANLLPALEAASERGLVTVCLLGRDGGPLAGRADHEIIVPAQTTERIQEAHQVLLHAVLDEVEGEYAKHEDR